MNLKEAVLDMRTPRLFLRLFARSRCPAQQELAAYADHLLIGSQRHAVERHLAGCGACVRQVAFLVRTAPMQGEPVPAELMHRASALGKREIRRAYPVWRLAAAGALGLVLLGIVGWRIAGHRSVSTIISTQKSATSNEVTVAENRTAPSLKDQLVRGNEHSDSPFLFPAAKQRVNTAGLAFRWKDIPGATFYEIELVTDDGSVIWSKKVMSSSVALPSSVHLVKGATYFVRLRIHNARHSVEVSKAVEFITQ